MSTKWDLVKEKATADILNAAALEFSEKGYKGATVRSIAARAQVSNGLVGKYFGSKESLLLTLLREVTLSTIFEGVGAASPYETFCIYIDHFRALQKEAPERFRLYRRLANDPEISKLIYDEGKRIFSGSLMEKSILEAQSSGELMAGDAYKLFRLFFNSLLGLLDQYSEIGVEAPDNDSILNIFGYDRNRIVYRQQEQKLSQTKDDLQLLLSAIRETYPLSISSNLTRNTYHMIDYDNFSTKKAARGGCYDDLIKVGASTIPSESDRAKFSDLFNRENLINAYKNGEREKSLIHLQTGDDGVDRWMSTRCIMSENADGDIIVISIGGIYDSTIKREAAYLNGDGRAVLEQIAREADIKAKSELLYNVSHDLRTPLNAIMGFNHIAMRSPDDRDKVIDCISKSQQSARLLLSMINGILDVGNLESGNISRDETACDIFYSFHNIDGPMRDLAESKGVALSFEYGDIRDRYVYCDFNRCNRVFVNLITNGIKYTREGGTVNVKCEQIPGSREGYGTYRYTFTDSGIGMSEEFLQRVYDKFAREDTFANSAMQGNGLGLAVCKAYVDMMGGTIECRSRQGEGTVFVITLPFRLAQAASSVDPITGEVLEDEGGETGNKPAALRGKQVLVVEDNELNREIATEILEEVGLIADEAENGAVAVNKLKENGADRYDFILMDIQMPVMNGYEAAKAIRAMYPDKHIPIIALSANALPSDREASAAAGMDDHVAKPISPEILFATMGKFL